MDHIFPLIRCDTDCLPSDLQAAPALGTIEAVVKLAADAGCDSIEIVQGLPLGRGHNVQLTFRDHPYLGLVAVFERFPLTGTYCK